MAIEEVVNWDTTARENTAVHPVGPRGRDAPQISKSIQEMQAAIARWRDTLAGGHNPVTLAGQDYLTLSTQEITASKLNIDDLANGTDGELITWSASGVATTVAVGTSTHVLTSNGVGAAPTFQAAGSGGGDVLKSGVPVNNQVALWIDDETIEGVAEFYFDGTEVVIDGGIDISGTIEFGTSGHKFGHESISSIYFWCGGSNTDADIVFKGFDQAVHGSVGSADAIMGFKDLGGHWTYKAANDASHTWYTDNETLRMTLSSAGVLTPTGMVQTVASATGSAGLNIPEGTAPTSPNGR